MDIAIFDKYYDALNPAFKEVVNLIVCFFAAYEKELNSKEEKEQ